MNKIDELKLGEFVKELAAQGHSSEAIAEILKNNGQDISHMTIYRYLNGSEDVRQDVDQKSKEIKAEVMEADAQRDNEYGERALQQIGELDALVEIAEKQLAEEVKVAFISRGQGRVSPIYEALKTTQYLTERKWKLLRALKPAVYAEYKKAKEASS